MPRYVAFLRAINVGGRRIKMDHLRQLFETLQFTNVETFIASGNVIFDSTSRNTKALEKNIEDHLQAALGYKVATFIRAISELATITRYKPFPEWELEDADNTLYVGFLAGEPGEEAKEKLLLLSTNVDDFHIHGRELYWLCRKAFSESQVSGAQLEKTLGMPATLRNSTTVKKIALKYS